MKTIIKSDKYKKARGGYSRILNISCQKCSSHICFYQKDGSGSLRRMYIDRIIKPTVSLSKKNLFCPKKHLLGIEMIYEKEKRLIDEVIEILVKDGYTISYQTARRPGSDFLVNWQKEAFDDFKKVIC